MSEIPSIPQPSEAQLVELEKSLIAMRDSLVKLSIQLNDIAFEGDVELRQQAAAQADAAIAKLKPLPADTKRKSHG